MLMISDFLGAKRVELERMARTLGLDMMSIVSALGAARGHDNGVAVGRRWLVVREEARRYQERRWNGGDWGLSYHRVLRDFPKRGCEDESGNREFDQVDRAPLR